MTTHVRTFILALVLGSVVSHASWSVAMAGWWSASYPMRMADLRRWPEEIPSVPMLTEMVSTFLSNTMRPSGGNTVFFGSSFVYGFPWQEEVVVSTRYAALRPDEHVINAAVVGFNLTVLENSALCGAANAGLQADTVIVELPVINSVNFRLRGEGDGGSLPAAVRCNEHVGRVPSWWFAARHPIGVGWVSFVWDNKAYPKPDSTVTIGAKTPAVFATGAEFARIEPELQRQVAAALERSKSVGREVYAFVSPVLLPGAEAVGFDASAIRAQLTSALAACQSVAGVHCLDIEPFYTRQEFFYNLTHLNQRGHQALAEWLAERIPPARR